MLTALFGAYSPNQVVAWKREGAECEIALLEGREAQRGKATAYECLSAVFRLPEVRQARKTSTLKFLRVRCR
jgi:hypothetical protein